MMQHIPGLFIAESRKKGRGVFTSKEISPGDLIEISPLIVLPRTESEQLDQTKLYEYYFVVDKPDPCIAIALGYGSLYNHSEEPNAIFELNVSDRQLFVHCKKTVAVGKEILVNYLDNKQTKIKLWF